MTIFNREQRIIRAENVIIAYPHLWEPFGNESGKSYGIQFMLSPQDPRHQAIAQEILSLTGELLQANKIDPQYAAQLGPLKSGDEKNQKLVMGGKQPRPELVGQWVVSANDKQFAPDVRDQAGNHMGADQSANIFGGCICNVVFNLYWFNAPQNRGVAAGLKLVQLINNVGVQRLGGGGGMSEEEAQSYLVHGQVPVQQPAGSPVSAGGGPPPLTSVPTNPGPMSTIPQPPGDGPSWL
jgi:hypothetical protein